jgi:hypothetical protein
VEDAVRKRGIDARLGAPQDLFYADVRPALSVSLLSLVRVLSRVQVTRVDDVLEAAAVAQVAELRTSAAGSMAEVVRATNDVFDVRRLCLPLCSSRC